MDAISREEVLKPYKDLKDDDVISVWLIRKNIEQQKSVQPSIHRDRTVQDFVDKCRECGKMRKGHWIAVYQGDEIINYRCSECELGDTNGSTDLYDWDYCRRCGADMKGEVDA